MIFGSFKPNPDKRGKFIGELAKGHIEIGQGIVIIDLRRGRRKLLNVFFCNSSFHREGIVIEKKPFIYEKVGMQKC